MRLKIAFKCGLLHNILQKAYLLQKILRNYAASAMSALKFGIDVIFQFVYNDIIVLFGGCI
jgi:hypothetical protein